MTLITVILASLIGFFVLLVAWLRVRDPGPRRRLGRVLLFLAAGAVGLTILFALFLRAALDEWTRSTEINECRVPLMDGHECHGFNDSWIECSWAFRAEGRPTPSLCRRFVSSAERHGPGEGVEDYDDVDRFRTVPCERWDLEEARYRCFEGVKTEDEAVNRYMLAFGRDCDTAVILRTCNLPLEEAAMK